MSETTNDIFNKFKLIIEKIDPIKVNGKVIDVIGLVIVSVGPNAVMGEICSIVDRNGNEVVKQKL